MAKYFNIRQALQDGGDLQGIQDYMKANNLTALPDSTSQANDTQSQPQPDLMTSIGKGAVDLVGNLLSPFTKTAQNIGGALFENSRGQQINQASKVSSDAIKQLQDVGVQLKKETDPVKKQQLIDQSRQLTDFLGGVNKQLNPTVNAQNPFLNNQQMQNVVSNPVGEATKNAAGVLSWGVPFGAGGNILTKALLPGFAVGALQNYSDTGKVGYNTVGAGLVGAGGAGVLHGAGSLLKGLGGVEKTVGDAVSQSTSGIRLPPSLYGAADEKAANKVWSEVPGITAAAKYENIQPTMQKFSNQIDEKLANNTKTLPVQDVVDAIKTSANNIFHSKELNSKTGQEALNGYIQDVYRQAVGDSNAVVPKEITGQQLHAFNQYTNKGFEVIQNKIKNGGVALTPVEQAQYVARKAISDVMQTEFPAVKELTQKQHALYNMMDSVEAQRTKGVPIPFVQGGQLPPRLTQGAGNLAGMAVGGVGNVTQGAGNLVNKVPGQVSSRIPGILGNILSPQSVNQTGNATQDQSTNGNNSGNNNVSADYGNSNINQILNTNTNQPQNQGQITPQDVKNAFLYLPEARATRIQEAYKAQYGNATAQAVGLVKSGISSVNNVEKMLKDDPSLLTKQLLPGHFASRTFDAALYNATDALLRLRTGAQANPTEIRGYMERLGPTFGDSKADIKYKLDQLRSSLNDYIQAQ